MRASLAQWRIRLTNVLSVLILAALVAAAFLFTVPGIPIVEWIGDVTGWFRLGDVMQMNPN